MKKRSVKIQGHSTSISMEQPFWEALKDLADVRNISLNALITEIDKKKAPESNLSSAVRIYILQTLQENLRALSTGAATRPERP